MRSLARALIALGIEFSNELTYMPSMAPRSANQAEFENGGMQVGVSTLTYYTLICRGPHLIVFCLFLGVV